MGTKEDDNSPHYGTQPDLTEKWHGLSPEMRIYYIELFLIAAVQIIDAFTYANAMQVPGAFERNPIIASIAERLSLLGIFSIKTLASATILLILELTRTKLNQGRTNPFINNSLRVLNSLYAIILINNISYLFLQN